MCSVELFERFESIRRIGLGVLDGGFATHLEDVLGHDISASSLWSASLLRTDDGRRTIVQAHLDFLHAGAQIVSTSTYQVSALAFEQAGLRADEARSSIIASVELADEARNACENAERPLVCLAVGPYGAALANGAECELACIGFDCSVLTVSTDTGDYIVPDAKPVRPPTIDELEAFHYDRLAVVAASPTWQLVDLIAIETVPRLDEAIAARNALSRVFAIAERKPTFVSFVFPDGRQLPRPAAMTDIVGEVLVHPAAFDGIGINCTKPYYLDALVDVLGKTLLAQRGVFDVKPLLFLYPDGGLVWDGIARTWKDGSQNVDAWSDVVLRAADNALRSSAWGACFVGGCCKSTTNDVASLRKSVNVRLD